MMKSVIQETEVIINDEIARAIAALENAGERGKCPEVRVGRSYIIYTDCNGIEVKLIYAGKFMLEIKAGNVILTTNAWNEFVLRHEDKLIVSRKVRVARREYTVEEFIEHLRRRFRGLLNATVASLV